MNRTKSSVALPALVLWLFLAWTPTGIVERLAAALDFGSVHSMATSGEAGVDVEPNG